MLQKLFFSLVVRLLALSFLLVGFCGVSASTLSSPNAEIVLTVTGNIANTNTTADSTTPVVEFDILDGYTIDISSVNFDQYPIIIAYKKNNEYMPIRDLGPLWLMFPFDDFPELLNEKNKAGAVWQLTQLMVR